MDERSECLNEFNILVLKLGCADDAFMYAMSHCPILLMDLSEFAPSMYRQMVRNANKGLKRKRE
jgi:hypothetical protein